MTVAFFISGHGFGHASREVEIINAVLASGATDIVLRTSADPGLLARTVLGPYRLLPGPCDPGIAQRDSVTHDDDASVASVQAYYRNFQQHVDDEVRRLDGLGVDLIVADIPPAAFSVAARLGVPSLAIANFTWAGSTRRCQASIAIRRLSRPSVTRTGSRPGPWHCPSPVA